MAESDPAPSSPPLAPAPTAKREDLQPVGEKIAELNESQSELLGRLRGLKEDLQNWRSKLDTQVKTYKDELTDLKQTLNTELEQLRLDFQELRTTLQKQQEDVTASLKNLGMQDLAESQKEEDQQKNNAECEEAALEGQNGAIQSEGSAAAESSP
ncbi:uncharacterized protein LOC109719048 [Ananas comosus]|uniref:Uncharacterized protein LOC109719048 n=1 Tax=Ananas comosus TaxID=4615 RepID=A0A6P5FZY7_ANACO|nr:uncharacterized protein LOC109719048 [Ananas comosus]